MSSQPPFITNLIIMLMMPVLVLLLVMCPVVGAILLGELTTITTT
jgi:hypothetical protein